MLRSLDHIPIGTIIYTEKTGIIFASEAFAHIVGWNLADLFGRKMEDFTVEEDRATSRWLLTTAIANRLPFTLKKRYFQPTGAVVWVENHYQILASQTDDVVVCLLSRRLDSLPPSPVLIDVVKDDYSKYLADMCLDLSAMAELSGREMASDLLRLVAKVACED